MKTKKAMKFACAALAAVMTAGVTVGCGGAKNYAENNTEYFIGCSGPLTGAAAVYGIGVKNAAAMAVEEINAAGGLNGVKFKFEMTDDANDQTKIAANYANLFEGGMQVSLGCVTTKPCLDFKGYAVDDEVFSITPSASGDDVTKDAPNVFQMCFTDSSQGKEAAKYVKDTFASSKDTVKLGVFYKSGEDYSQGLYNNFKAEFGTDWDGYNVTVATFTDGQETDFSSQVDQLKDCDFIFMPVYYGPGKTFMLQGNGKVKESAVYFGCDGFDGIDAIEGFNINTVPQEVSMLSHFNSKATDGKAKEFVDKYNAKYTSAADKGTLSQFGAAAYDCVYAIYQAMKETVDAGTEIPANIAPAELNKLLCAKFNSAEFSFSGATGTNVKWNADGTVDKVATKYVIKAKNA